MIGILAALSLSLTPSAPSLPLFGPGPLFNLGKGDAAITNASAHVAWSMAVPLAGERLGGRKGLWIAGLSWIALSFAQETFFHPGSAPEERTDIVTRCAPTAGILIWDLWQHR